MTVDEVLALLTRVACEGYEVTNTERDSVLGVVLDMIGGAAVIHLKDGQGALVVTSDAWPICLSFADDGDDLDDGGSFLAGLFVGLREDGHREVLLEAARAAATTVGIVGDE